MILLFVGSGCAALIYQVVWFQMLQLVIGSSAISLGVLLATFMGGMCVGSLSWPRLVGSNRHPLRVYAALELGIGVIGLLVLFALPLAGKAYTAVAVLGPVDPFLRAIVCALCLLPPTFMMGATLPVIARWIETTPRGVSWLGYFYGGNTLGAVLGCMLAGFYLLRVHDMATATYAAVAINFIVGGLAWLVASFAPHRAVESAAADPAPAAAEAVPARWAIYATLALSGLCALSAEVIWTRMLSLMFGGTVYTFSMILAVFLTGLGIGSTVGSAIARETRRPRVILGWCQLLQAAGIAWAAYVLAETLPYWPVDQSLGAGIRVQFEVDLLRTAWAVFPSALLWGASFPLALASLVSPGEDPGRVVGSAYAANTLGAVAGSLLSGLVLIPAIGMAKTQQTLIGLTIVSAFIALAAHRRASPRGSWIPVATGLAVSALAGIFFIRSVPALPWPLVAFGRELMVNNTSGMVSLYQGEGLNATVGVTESWGSVRSFHVAGKTEASTLPKDMRLQRMLGHIPALFHPNPKSVLIVGCGAGVTAGSFVTYPGIERIVICEIEPLIPTNIAPYFAEQNHNVVKDPRVEIIYDDARHYILTTKEKFDIITSDPIHPWVKGAATLYTEEYFGHVKARLNPGGLVTQWVPFYESDEAVVQSEIATFFKAFPGGTVWGNDQDGFGYDVVMLGQPDGGGYNIDEMQARLRRPDYARVLASLNDVGLGEVPDLIARYAGRDEDLAPMLAGAEINRDRNLRLQYLAGLQLNSQGGRQMYGPMLTYRRFPSDLLKGSPETLQTARTGMGL